MSVYLAWRRRFADLQTASLEAGANAQNSLTSILDYLTAYRQHNLERVAKRQAEAAIKRGEDWFAMQSGELFCYDFSESEIKEIQQHLDVLRELIAGAEELQEEHKLRLFRRLDQLRAELNKKVSDLDRFWGLIGDVRVVVQKIKDQDRVTKTLQRVWLIAKIVFAAQQIAHQLPPHDDHTHLMLPPPPAAIEDHPAAPAAKAPPKSKPKTTVA